MLRRSHLKAEALVHETTWHEAFMYEIETFTLKIR